MYHDLKGQLIELSIKEKDNTIQRHARGLLKALERLEKKQAKENTTRFTSHIS